MARPRRSERNRATQSFRQLKRFHYVIKSDKVFGTHTGAEKRCYAEIQRATLRDYNRLIPVMESTEGLRV